MPIDKHESIIIKSLTNSTALEVSDDGKCVRSKNEIIPKDQADIDECTIYIEQIPLDSNHDSIKAIFSKFGNINYVSLPRFKNSRQLKQFGFIEFESKESVNKCLECFKKFDGAILCAKPDKLLSIVTHDESSKPVVEEEIKVEEVKEEDEICEEKTETEETTKKKKNRKHKRKQKKPKLIDERVVSIKIMRKTLWKKMRNEYLNLERQKAKEVKKALQESRKTNVKSQLVKFSPVVNFYKSPSTHDSDASHDVAEEKNDSVKVVNIKFREVSNDVRELRNEFRQFSYVKHVEIIDNGAECNIRVLNEKNAQDLVSLYDAGCEHSATILNGESETEYWKRLTEKKERGKRKLEIEGQSPPCKKQRRGREKLHKMIMKASSSQHIRFNENFENAEEK